MRSLAVIGLLFFALPGAQASNFDFSKGTLEDWQGTGFYVTTARAKGPSLTFGVCSSDAGTPGGTGERRYRFVVPQRAGLIRFSAYAHWPENCPPNDQMDVRLMFGPALLPKLVKTETGWEPVVGLLSRWKGKPREYAWDVSSYVGQTLEVVLWDEDPRPNCYLFCGRLQIYPASLRKPLPRQESVVSRKLRLLEKQYNWDRFSQLESTFFTAWSNAEDYYAKSQMQNGDMFYRLFFAHFQRRGFALTQPSYKLQMVIFNAPKELDAFLGKKLPRSITGLYNRNYNSLVLYDIRQHEGIVASHKKALKIGEKIPLDMDRAKFIQSVKYNTSVLTQDIAVSSTMHEVAHQLSFNCGLLNRNGDVPLWLGEGLACYCESTSQGSWQGIGRPNPERIAVLSLVKKRGGNFIPLRNLLTSDNWRTSSQQAILGYSQSWALFRMLMTKHPRALKRYLTLIYPRRTNDHRLTDFCQVFGSDLNRFEKQYHRYLDELIQ